MIVVSILKFRRRIKSNSFVCFNIFSICILNVIQMLKSDKELCEISCTQLLISVTNTGRDHMRVS